MELHDHLRALAQRLGPGVFDEPDGFRGALDDFLAEDDASTGEVNLLVDAVRLGAYAALISMLDSGADQASAVAEAGVRLARDRGSADVAGSQWACAVLGFAIGRVDAVEVARRRDRSLPGASGAGAPATRATAIRPDLPATVLPPQPSGPPPSYVPTAPPPAPPPHGGAPSSWGSAPSPPPARRRRRALLALGVVAVLAVAAGVVAAVVTGGDGGADPSSPDSSLSTDLADVDQRYAALGTSVTAGSDACTSISPAAGETEKLTCATDDGDLTLVTFESADAQDDSRERIVDLADLGGVYLETGDDVVYGFDAEANPSDDINVSSLYWNDTDALQSARYLGDDDTDGLDLLVERYRAAGGSLPYPTEPTDPDLIAFLERVSDVGDCERIPTLGSGELEESSCDARGGITVYYGKWAERSSMTDYRKNRAEDTRESGGKPDTWFLTETPDVKIGVLDQYRINVGDDDEQSVIYWDDTDCLCYGQAFVTGDDQSALFDWWANS